MGELPRIILEPVPEADAYHVIVETPEDHAPIERVEPVEQPDGAVLYQVWLTDSVHWSDARLKADIRPL